MDPNLLVFGRPTPPPAPIPLRAGPLTMELDPESGSLRYLELPDGTEAVRAIYPTLRLPDWKTIAPTVSDLQVDAREDGFTVRYRLAYEVGQTVEVRIEGGAAGIEFAYAGEATQAFETARTGLCVLHPAAQADLPVEIRHPDGTRESGRFPDLVQPEWPFREIVGVSVKLPGFKVNVTMEGETFEMEDQRNFGDASFKTYCRPQSLPMRYIIEAGQKVVQTVRVAAQAWGSKVEGLPPLPDAVAGLLFVDDTVPLPLLGLSVGPTATPEAVAAAPVDFVRIKASEARDLPKPLEVVVDSEEHLDPVTALESPVERLIAPLGVAERIEALRAAAGEALVVLASERFDELNRSGLGEKDADGLGFGWNPQAHLTDDRTLFENVESLPDLAATAAERTEGPIVVGPLELGSGSDPRKGTLLEAAWLVAALGALVQSDVDAATLMDLDDLTREGRPTPAWHVLSDLHEFAEGELVVGVGTTRRAAGFALVLDESFRAIAANLTPLPIRLSVVAAGDEAHVVKILDGRNLERALSDPEGWRAEPGEAVEPEEGVVEFDLGPYGVARIDAEVDELEDGNN